MLLKARHSFISIYFTKNIVFFHKPRYISKTAYISGKEISEMREQKDTSLLLSVTRYTEHKHYTTTLESRPTTTNSTEAKPMLVRLSVSYR